MSRGDVALRALERAALAGEAVSGQLRAVRARLGLGFECTLCGTWHPTRVERVYCACADTRRRWYRAWSEQREGGQEGPERVMDRRAREALGAREADAWRRHRAQGLAGQGDVVLARCEPCGRLVECDGAGAPGSTFLDSCGACGEATDHVVVAS